MAPRPAIWHAICHRGDHTCCPCEQTRCHLYAGTYVRCGCGTEARERLRSAQGYRACGLLHAENQLLGACQSRACMQGCSCDVCKNCIAGTYHQGNRCVRMQWLVSATTAVSFHLGQPHLVPWRLTCIRSVDLAVSPPVTDHIADCQSGYHLVL